MGMNQTYHPGDEDENKTTKRNDIPIPHKNKSKFNLLLLKK